MSKRSDKKTESQDKPAKGLLSRRKALGLLSGTLAGAVSAQSAYASDRSFFDEVFNKDRDRDKERAARRARKAAEKLDDLRAGPVPLRSDEMLERLDRAIAHYRKIVQKGGWPTTKKIRLIRPGDDNDAGNRPPTRHV